MGGGGGGEEEEEEVSRLSPVLLLLCHCLELPGCPASALCCWLALSCAVSIDTVQLSGEPSSAFCGLYSSTANCRCTLYEEADELLSAPLPVAALSLPEVSAERVRRADGSMARVRSRSLPSPGGHTSQPAPPP